LAASQQFTAIWPTGEYPGEVLAAILNGPIANAYVTEHTTDHDFTNIMLGTLPLPKRLDTQAVVQAVREYQSALKRSQAIMQVSEDERLNELLVKIDALVLEGYDLPPRLERRILDYFKSYKRPTIHKFDGWMPANVEAFIPLHEWLSGAHRANRGNWITNVVKPVPVQEAIALARFID
jgi:hypothetical protein